MDAVIRSVSNAYRTFEYYQEHKEEVERHTLTDFAESTTSHGDGSIRTSLEEMHALVVPRGGVLGGGRGVFEMLSEGLRVSEWVWVSGIWDMGERERSLLAMDIVRKCSCMPEKTSGV